MRCPICQAVMVRKGDETTPQWWFCPNCHEEEPPTEFDSDDDLTQAKDYFEMYPLEGGDE